jgi:hypothetical protein
MTLRGSARPAGTAGFDLRTKEARLMRRTRERLTAHVGTPTAVQRALIERCVALTVHLARADNEALKTGVKDFEAYLSLTGHLTRILDKLGTKAVEPEPPSLASYLAGRVEEDA